MAIMDGTEHFCANGGELDVTMTDFWKWAYSDLSEISQRSMLSEYIVASAMNAAGVQNSRSDFSMKPYDLITENGFTVSIKSAAYIQSQDARQPDCISFSISSHKTGTQNKRGSDIHIFCLYKGMGERDTPLNLDLWEFYILRSSVLDEKKPTKKTITLPSLMRLEPLWCDYYGIGDAIQTIMSV